MKFWNIVLVYSLRKLDKWIAICYGEGVGLNKCTLPPVPFQIWTWIWSKPWKHHKPQASKHKWHDGRGCIQIYATGKVWHPYHHLHSWGSWAIFYCWKTCFQRTFTDNEPSIKSNLQSYCPQEVTAHWLNKQTLARGWRDLKPLLFYQVLVMTVIVNKK